MASCNLCNSFGLTKIQYNYKLAKEHAVTHFAQMKIIDDGIYLNQMFGQCFPDFEPVNTQDAGGESGRRTVVALCHSLFTRKSVPPHFVCKKCDEEVKICGRRNHLDPNLLIEHACNHLGLNVYECRHCDQEFKVRTAVSTHLAKKHQLRTSIDHFRCKVDDFVGEISAMIKACFGGEKKAFSSAGVTVRSACISNVRCRTKGSHLATERQVLCYRLVRKAVDRNGNVKCHLCSKGIKATDGKRIRCQPVRDHAYRHLPTPIFRCRLCSEAYFGITEMGAHLQAAHALPCLIQNYECLADQYHSELLAIINKCYSNDAEVGKEVASRNLSDSKAGRKSARSKLAVHRQVLCHQLIRKRVRGEGLVECSLCAKQVTAKNGNTFTSCSVLDHALSHLDKALYQCKKCSSSFRTRSALRGHLNLKHALPHNLTNYQCFADQFHRDIVRILHQCYDEEEESEEVQRSGKHRSIGSKMAEERQRLCIQLIRECGDRERKTLQCRVCNKCIGVRDNNCATNHALTHLEKPIYRCKICSDTSITINNFAYHVKTKHALPTANNYECLGDEFHTETMEMVRKCYNNDNAHGPKPLKKSRTRGESNVRGRGNGSKQSVERQLFCYRLIRKYGKSDDKVECRLCKKRIGTKNGGHYTSSRAMMHAVIHLNKPIYRCVVCSEMCHNLNSINHHLNKTHGMRSMANNYVSLADEYDSEIMAMLRECYGET